MSNAEEISCYLLVHTLSQHSRHTLCIPNFARHSRRLRASRGVLRNRQHPIQYEATSKRKTILDAEKNQKQQGSTKAGHPIKQPMKMLDLPYMQNFFKDFFLMSNGLPLPYNGVRLTIEYIHCMSVLPCVH